METELPDGEHTCIVTRQKLVVKDSTIQNLELDAQGAIVISHVAQRVKGKTIVRAQLHRVDTKPGETIAKVKSQKSKVKRETLAMNRFWGFRMP